MPTNILSHHIEFFTQTVYTQQNLDFRTPTGLLLTITTPASHNAQTTSCDVRNSDIYLCHTYWYTSQSHITSHLTHHPMTNSTHLSTHGPRYEAKALIPTVTPKKSGFPNCGRHPLKKIENQHLAGERALFQTNGAEILSSPDVTADDVRAQGCFHPVLCLCTRCPCEEQYRDV